MTGTDTFDMLSGLLAARRSYRGFLDEEVPRDVIEQLLTAIQRTASWCNTQPWHLDVTSREQTAKLREALASSEAGFEPDFDFPPGYEGVYDQRRRESGLQYYATMGVEKGDREGSARVMMRNFDFFDAPHVAILTTEASLGVYGAIDCGLYVQSFLLAAEALGLGASAQAALAMRSPFLRDWFDLPDTRKVVCGISFGYPDLEHPSTNFRTSRADVSESVTFHW